MLPDYWGGYIPPWICTHGYEEVQNYRKTLLTQSIVENGWWVTWLQIPHIPSLDASLHPTHPPPGCMHPYILASHGCIPPPGSAPATGFNNTSHNYTNGRSGSSWLTTWKWDNWFWWEVMGTLLSEDNDWYSFILLSRESDGGAMCRTNPDSLRSCLCFQVFRLNFLLTS